MSLLTTHDSECIELCPFEGSAEKCRVMHSCAYCSNNRWVDPPSPIEILNQHWASISDADESKMYDRLNKMWDDSFDLADLALRTCQCGTTIEGFYEYLSHLKDVLT